MAEIQQVEGNAEHRERLSAMYSRAFASDPVIEYMLGMAPEQKAAYLPKYFQQIAFAASLNRALFYEADGGTSCAIAFPPGERIDSPSTLLRSGLIRLVIDIGFAATWRMISEFPSQIDPLKKKWMPGRKYYYLFFIGTDPDHQGKGLAPAILRKVLERAGKEGLPVWIEATTERSRHTYRKVGFEDVAEVKLGKGKVNAEGRLEKGGPGVSMFAMIWWPEKKTQS